MSPPANVLACSRRRRQYFSSSLQISEVRPHRHFLSFGDHGVLFFVDAASLNRTAGQNTIFKSNFLECERVLICGTDVDTAVKSQAVEFYKEQKFYGVVLVDFLVIFLALLYHGQLEGLYRYCSLSFSFCFLLRGPRPSKAKLPF